MRRAKSGIAIFTMLLFFGIGNVLHYSDKVRFVDLLGISGSGATCGAAIVGIIGSGLVLTRRLGLATADTRPLIVTPLRLVGMVKS
jgi:hypothetical protein